MIDLAEVFAILQGADETMLRLVKGELERMIVEKRAAEHFPRTKEKPAMAGGVGVIQQSQLIAR